ncbi:MAG TPA: DNA mismatch repair protein MutS, partial [Blastocatellia bacterium]|nr:DNA mismatch repair protein MutS [Blastocatellia bacterium]
MQSPTPMLRQYQEIKREYPGTLLFFRLGDFYEMFFEDAVIGSKELEITLTARNREKGNPVPMCGVPYHAAAGYIAKLVRKGYRVAICEQTEDPKKTTKLVRREVVRVITPGTAIDSQLLDARDNNYLAAVFGTGHGMAVAFLDISTGEFRVTEFGGSSGWQDVIAQLDSFAPKEIVFPNSLEPLFKRGVLDGENGSVAAALSLDFRPSLTAIDDWHFSIDRARELLETHFGVLSLEGFGLKNRQLAMSAAGAALHYARETQKSDAEHISGISFYQPSEYLILDSPTVRNLELVDALDGSRSQTLLTVLDETMTGMGSRLLRQWLVRPSTRPGEIVPRQEAVGELKNATILRDRLRGELKKIADLDRLMARVSLGRVTGRDFVALKNSADCLPGVRELLADARSSLLEVLRDAIDELADVRMLIGNAVVDDPPSTLADGGYIRAGYNAELDELRSLATSSKSFIAGIESRERTRTGISSLKVRFNNVFGYFIEVSKA